VPKFPGPEVDASAQEKVNGRPVGVAQALHDQLRASTPHPGEASQMVLVSSAFPQHRRTTCESHRLPWLIRKGRGMNRTVCIIALFAFLAAGCHYERAPFEVCIHNSETGAPVAGRRVEFSWPSMGPSPGPVEEETSVDGCVSLDVPLEPHGRIEVAGPDGTIYMLRYAELPPLGQPAKWCRVNIWGPRGGSPIDIVITQLQARPPR
jgi:hypothetical protein